MPRKQQKSRRVRSDSDEESSDRHDFSAFDLEPVKKRKPSKRTLEEIGPSLPPNELLPRLDKKIKRSRSRQLPNSAFVAEPAVLPDKPPPPESQWASFAVRESESPLREDPNESVVLPASKNYSDDDVIFVGESNSTASSSSSSSPAAVNRPLRLLALTFPASLDFAADQDPFGISFQELLGQEVPQRAFFINMMVQLPWLAQTVPWFDTCPCIEVVKNDKVTDQEHEFLQYLRWRGRIIQPVKPQNGIHHSKAIFLFYPDRLRVCILSANFIERDFTTLNQTAWFQDFPRVQNYDASAPLSEFGEDLYRYMRGYEWCHESWSLQGRETGSKEENIKGLNDLEAFRWYTYDTQVVLVPSRPNIQSDGSINAAYYSPEMDHWGHRKVRAALLKAPRQPEAKSTCIVMQSSSMGRIHRNWWESLRESFSANGRQFQLKMVWPSLPHVRQSLTGYSDAGCMPVVRNKFEDGDGKQKQYKNMCVRENLYHWQVPSYQETVAKGHLQRGNIIAHAKTYVRVGSQGQLDWVMTGSHNVSKGAWGEMQKNNSRLCVKQYELSVLFLPSRFGNATFRQHGFSQPNDTGRKIVEFPLVHNLCPTKYESLHTPVARLSETSPDCPWTIDTHQLPDKHGYKWERRG